MHEGFPQEPGEQKEISEAAVIEALRNEPDVARCDLYLAWRKQEEAKAKNTYDDMMLTFRDAKLLFAAGLDDLAWEASADAKNMATSVDDREKVEEIRAFRKRIRPGA